jgi:iron(III) transport system substrate-binding protein
MSDVRPQRRCSLLIATWVLIGHACLLAGCLTGCERSASKPATQLVLYTSVDEPYVKPIIAEFESKTGVKVLVQTDTEATKSAGLAARVEAERNKPRADVWWGNEVFHTIRLAEAGLLAPYESQAAKDIPEKFKDAGHRWAGAGLRARVIAWSTYSSYSSAKPFSIDDLADPVHRGRVAIARPTAGTTGSHVAALYVLWGPDRFKAFMRRLKANDVKLLGGNGPVAEAVGRGELVIGLTDNDDVSSVQRNGGKITQELPDQDTVGTLAIPTTVGLIAGARNAGPAKQLIDYLLSPEVERKLIDAKFAGWSVRAPTSSLRMMDIDYAAASRALPRAVESAMTILEGRE